MSSVLDAVWVRRRWIPFHAQGPSGVHTHNFPVRQLDAQRERYDVPSELSAHPKARIEAGETVVERHLFDLPQDARGVRLEVSFGTIPDALD